MLGGQISPEGGESLNLRTFEKLRVGEDKEWVRLADLKVARRQLGCAVVRDKAGRLGIVAVGGTGDSDTAATAVEFYDLQAGQQWETWPDISTARCCWPQVGTRTPPACCSLNTSLGWNAGKQYCRDWRGEEAVKYV